VPRAASSMQTKRNNRPRKGDPAENVNRQPKGSAQDRECSAARLISVATTSKSGTSRNTPKKARPDRSSWSTTKRQNTAACKHPHERHSITRFIHPGRKFPRFSDCRHRKVKAPGCLVVDNLLLSQLLWSVGEPILSKLHHCKEGEANQAFHSDPEPVCVMTRQGRDASDNGPSKEWDGAGRRR